MMAATILVVGFVGMIQAITIGSEMLDAARKQQVATQIMDDEIERLRTSSWNNIASLASTSSSSTRTIAISNTGAISGHTDSFALSDYSASTADDNTALCALAKGFTCSYTRTYLRPGSATSTTVTYIKYVYTVTWKGNTGRSYSRSAEAYFGQNGLHLSYQRS